jgi:hypothetical protein
MNESWHSVHSVNEPLDNERGKTRKTASDHRIRAGPNQQTRIEDNDGGPESHELTRCVRGAGFKLTWKIHFLRRQSRFSVYQKCSAVGHAQTPIPYICPDQL